MIGGAKLCIHKTSWQHHLRSIRYLVSPGFFDKTPMNRQQVKNQVVDLLATEDLETIVGELSVLPKKNLLNALFSCLCNPQGMVRWHAISGFGFVVPAIASKNMEEARTVMRRFLWMLNDESGGIGWGIPEAMAEVMLHCKPLASEYLHMLVSYTMDDGPVMFQDGNFLELDLLQEGVLWGLCRVAPDYRDELVNLRLDDNLEIYFGSQNSTVKGLVCRLTGILGPHKFCSFLVEASTDQRSVRLYHEGTFIDTCVADLARDALKNV